MSVAARTGAVALEVLRTRFKAVAEEMAQATLRTAFTVFVKETHDFGACLVSPRGDVFAAPTDTAVSIMAGLPARVVVDALEELEEGDVGIANDPDLTRGLSTHLPDIWLWKPIFVDGRLLAFGLSFIHSSDVGGKVPGSISPTNHEIHQEGLRIPPSKLVRAGRLNRELLELILANSRIPEQNRGDIRAQLASLNIAERRMRELAARYGAGVVAAGIEDVIDHAEARARALIERIPDGVYRFTDYMEGDDAGAGLIRIKLAMHVRGGDIVLDFAGTDPQVKAALNLPTWNQRGHRQITFALLNHLRSADPSIPYNSGLVRPIELRIPRGTLLNPEPGAACGVRAATMFRVMDCVCACLAQALPDAMPAAGSGAVAIVLLAIWDGATGTRRVEVAQPLNGGSGGRPRQDGIDGANFAGGWLRNIPNEVLEADMPVLVEEYGYRPGSGGAGRHRGGAGIRFRLRSLAPEMTVTARGLERFTFRPWGLRGGRPGRTGRVVLNPGTEGERELGKLDVLSLDAGDVVQFETAGGGGLGDPRERDAARVAADVAAGMVTADEARADHGAAPAAAGALFDVGPERRAYEEAWPEEEVDEMLTTLDRYPPRLRPLLRDRVRAEAERAGPGRPRLPALVDRVAADTGVAG